MTRIAIVGMACRYPDATSARELWENVLAGRRAFRRLPDVRTRLADYWDPDPGAPDRFYARHAAVIEGYDFDRVAYKIAGSTYRSTDLTHWLALDVATQALADAGFPMGEGLPQERTAVVVGNTLTGEFSRANGLRLRWPYVRRTVAAALKEKGWDDIDLAPFLGDLETRYKSAFPAVDEDTLAGALANTIAGRICNYFDLNGGGYTVDGACSSSLLSVVTASRALIDGDVDVAIAGGVDLSIDPFELIGFAKTGALATGEMRVYDRGSCGFWPGEGCGMIVLMREADAAAAGHRIYAAIVGWGISSDGKGGITRPAVSGYRLSLSRAYERAGFGIETVGLFEGHGTGTPVGDATELRALSLARRAADPTAPRAAIGTIKAMIGHTKAAAGVAGLIKAAMAVHRQVIPPTVGCFDPHPELTASDAVLRVLSKAEAWPDGTPVRAGVTSMGFGGINAHVVLESVAPRRRATVDSQTGMLASSRQDAEVLLVDAGSAAELRDRLAMLAEFVPALAYAQLTDLAATLQRELRDRPSRAAVVVTSPDDAESVLQFAVAQLDAGAQRLIDVKNRVFLGRATGTAQLGYLFPGQGSGRATSGGALRRRFAQLDEVYQRAALPSGGDTVATAVAQPRIVTGTIAGLRVLTSLGLDARVAVGHSLGEISALHWAGVMDEATLLRVACLRGATMTEFSASGTMAGIGAPPDAVAALHAGEPVVVAGHNGPRQTVVAGPVEAIARVCRRAGEAGLEWARLAVSHAFHSPLVAPAAQQFADRLAGEQFDHIGQRIVSTVTGQILAADTDVVDLLRRQITSPVLFAEAVAAAAAEVDLFVEVGPGQVLSRMVRDITDVPAVGIDTDSESLESLLSTVAAAHVVGAPLAYDALFHGRLVRPLQVGASFAFLANPCEEAPPLDAVAVARPTEKTAAATAHTVEARTAEARTAEAHTVEAHTVEARTAQAHTSEAHTAQAHTAEAHSAEVTIDLLRRLAAERAELPLDAVHEDSLLMDDLHLSSISVGQVMNRAAQHLGLPAAQTPTTVATATLRELADALDQLGETALPGDAALDTVAGAAAWTRAFTVDLDEVAVPARVAAEGNGVWRAHSPDGHPFAEPLRQALENGGVGSGVLACLPADPTVDDLRIGLTAAREALAQPAGGRFVLVQYGRGATGLAKTLHLEAPMIQTTVLRLPAAGKRARVKLDQIVAEVAATTGFAEVHYDTGHRRVPTLRAMPVAAAGTARPPLGSDDVLLVTGGGKGITAECALAMATDYGVRLAVMGRSDPAHDAELAANLDRMRAAGVTVHYVRADVTEPARVAAALADVAATLGPVTAVLHGAGRNEPAALTSLDLDSFRRVFAPKVDGLRAVLDAVDTAGLRLLVTFGSIIGRAGLRGEAHYATANEWLAELTTAFARTHKGCRTLCLEWSVWSGVGMGERLSVVESLMRDGVAPISPDQGVAVLRRLLADPRTPPVVVVTGRTENLDTIRLDRPELPLLRFVERPLVRYHGVELVTEVELAGSTDPYLEDHELDGNLLFPAVFGLEAMAQVAAATLGRTGALVLADVEFSRPVVIPPGGATSIRIAAVVTGDDTVAVAIRSSETSYAVDHFRATVILAAQDAPDGPPESTGGALPKVALEPLTQLYGGILFQGKRFQRLVRYHRAAARHVDADVAVQDQSQWFNAFLPGTLLLGDPGMRDALMHGNQVCVPDATLLPAGVERIYPACDRLAGESEVTYSAVEREQRGDTYVYDIAVRTADGAVVERWEGLRLQAVRRNDGRGPWVAPLLGPHLERNVGTRLGAAVAVAVEPDNGGDRRAGTAVAVGRTLGAPITVRYRPDGRPEVDGGRTVSAAHGAGVTLAVSADGPVACDVEAVRARGGDWSGLLGGNATLADVVAAEAAEPADVARTRVWCAIECLQKVGATTNAPLTLRPGAAGDGWVVLVSGTARVATFVTTLEDVAEPVVFAILAGTG